MNANNPCRIALVLLLAFSASAATRATETQFRDPGSMKEDERARVMGYMNDYNGCVYKESMARVEKYPDIRQAADQGMEACKGKLQEMKDTLGKAGFEPGFGEQFAHSTQMRAVRMLMPELALKKSGP